MKKSTHPVASTTSTTSQEPFDLLAPAFRAIPDDHVLAVNVDCPSVVSIVRAAAPRVLPFRAEIVHHLPTFEIACVDRLDACALALERAHSRYLTVVSPVDPLPGLLATAVPVRDSLHVAAKAAADRGQIASATLVSVGTSHGYADVATDLLTLSTLFRAAWPAVAGHTFVERTELDRAQSLGDEMRLAIGRRADPDASRAKAIDDRRRAYTYLSDTYAQVRRAMAYIRFAAGDAEEIAPSLYLHANEPPRRKPADTVPTAPVASVPAAPLVNAAPLAPGSIVLKPEDSPFES